MRTQKKNQNIYHKDFGAFVPWHEFLYQCIGPCNLRALQLKCVGVPFNRASACMWNVAENAIVSMWVISCWVWGNTTKMSCQCQQSCGQCWRDPAWWRGGSQREQKPWKYHSKCAKVLLHNASYHLLHYSINWDLGERLIKMSVPRKAKPCRDLPEFELMRYLDCSFFSYCPKGYVIILSCEVHLCPLIFTK